jgi:hypothetical protein
MARQDDELFKALAKAWALAENPSIKNEIALLADRIRLPMADILGRVPGATVGDRCKAIGISRQTYYVWAREEARPLREQSEHIHQLTGVPVRTISARIYQESEDDVGEARAAPLERVAQDGERVPRRRGRVRSASGENSAVPIGRARRFARSGVEPRLGRGPRKMRRGRSQRPSGEQPVGGDAENV